ncbi:PREDICTED: uncharacterized protein LOC109588303 [Amphimedon queenslandica]|uniref:Uncharacterized protein n=1 Tax=Amphimedon queenslandica TaxID=400682 RepID=A0AAN0JSM1_AMPQE|nr:PREDICTED: uncharacterized protein LOC109588303 [Amphimedon queenslandica]|eukprot:XP_019860032.1 PREDICTED: uncharacterized protein LOC109588303 [Amphimedon queenslandica]
MQCKFVQAINILFSIFAFLLIIEDYKKLEAKVADSEVYVTKILGMKTQVEEKKKIITEDYEKLKLKIANLEEQYLKEKQIIIDDNQNLKTDISEKDKVIAKLTSQVEEQLQNEKQIITELKCLIMNCIQPN